MQPDFNMARAFVDALTAGQSDTVVIDMRAIHDQNKSVPAIPRRGTLAQCWHEMVAWNSQGYGIFMTINAMDGTLNQRGQPAVELANVQAVRAHFLDLDRLDAMQVLEQVKHHQPPPSFWVQSSPGKAHVYWPVTPYRDNQWFTDVQRRLLTLYGGDHRIIDATRVMRVPGFFHRKGQPFQSTFHTAPGWGYVHDPSAIHQSVQHVQIDETGMRGTRQPIGSPELAAPSVDMLHMALARTDPNDMDRDEWISFMSAFKQAGSTLIDPHEHLQLFLKWCERYTVKPNNPGENVKMWNSIRSTEVGWGKIARLPNVAAMIRFGATGTVAPTYANPPASDLPSTGLAVKPPPGAISPDGRAGDVPEPIGGYMTADQYARLFGGCVFIERFGEILSPTGRMLNQTKFNGKFGGHEFQMNDNGKSTDEPYKAALRSQIWRIPKVDHIRFMPHMEAGAIVTDELGRKGVNTYRPATIKMRDGDPSPYLRHIAMLHSNPADQKLLHDYIAHNVKYPGHKIPWSPLIQSAEGAGKGVIKMTLRHCMGGPYCHFPNAKELAESGSKFNAWMRSKLMIICDEIKVDDRRDMIEVLKPMISEAEIEIQGKGHDQDKEDNYSNWVFFSNWKDAIPVGANGRRFAIFYSDIQSVNDLMLRQMGKPYFDGLHQWLQSSGLEIIANYYMNYPIERGAIPMRAPDTSSTAEAQRVSLGPVERAIKAAIEDQRIGFRNGWISSLAVAKRLRELHIRTVGDSFLERILTEMGYFLIGRGVRPYPQEDMEERAQLFYRARQADVAMYPSSQGYPG